VVGMGLVGTGLGLGNGMLVGNLVRPSGVANSDNTRALEGGAQQRRQAIQARARVWRRGEVGLLGQKSPPCRVARSGRSLPSPTSLAGRPLLPSGHSAPWASGMVTGFVAAVPRPARSRAYASPAALPRPSQGSLPVGAVTPSPDGFRTRWTTYRIS
jgi:hypothetical protein